MPDKSGRGKRIMVLAALPDDKAAGVPAAGDPAAGDPAPGEPAASYPATGALQPAPQWSVARQHRTRHPTLTST
ncbi:hypothetical protein [Alcanivorax quisquiliarum]|uniref:Uncharacterized protein n=1 Tax=Alcanivorax quisquiliarum TaxID=2933565 RepID=A0ABT0E9V6_9GAMM|nr:hypothetical protein [Alcanivorax quisquiliarum]MCK0538439.1 hypothetical protein [Alcanivorax quisquiliarum]